MGFYPIRLCYILKKSAFKLLEEFRVFGAGTFVNFNGCGSKVGSGGNGFFKAVTFGKTHNGSGKESVACAGGINKVAGAARAMSFCAGAAVIKNGAVFTHGYDH